MADLLAHDDAAIRERTCMALTVLAGLADGKAMIVRDKLILKNLHTLAEHDIAEVRYKGAMLLEYLSFEWMFADALVAAGFIRLLLRVVVREEDEIAEIHLDTLKSLMYGEGKTEALENEGFESFVYLMHSGIAQIKSKAAGCLMMVTSAKIGKEMAYDTGILVLLNDLLHSEITEIYTSAASAIMFCTVKSRAKFRASEQPGIYERLVNLANDWHNVDAQMYSIQALTNMCELPATRKEIRENYLDTLEKIVVGNNQNLVHYKETLLKVINWVPWVQPP